MALLRRDLNPGDVFKYEGHPDTWIVPTPFDTAAKYREHVPTPWGEAEWSMSPALNDEVTLLGNVKSPTLPDEYGECSL
jgi:hypothetical protein